MGCVMPRVEEVHINCGSYKGDSSDRLDKILASNKVVVFSQLKCPECWQLKRLFHEHGITYTIVEIDECSDFQTQLLQRTGQKQLPQVFFHGKYIGGFQSMRRLQARGKLWELVGRKIHCPEENALTIY